MDNNQAVSFQVIFDKIKGWRRDNSIRFSGTKVVMPTTTTTTTTNDGTGGLLKSLPWDVHLEFGHCNLCTSTTTTGRSSTVTQDREVFCLFSLSNYNGLEGTQLLLLGRLPQFSFHDNSMVEGMTCSLPLI